MKIELKNIKYAAFASEETHCFEATIYVDGKKVGNVRNDGKGGSDWFDPPGCERPIDDYAKTLPKYEAWGMTMEHSAEEIIGDLVNAWLVEKDVRRLVSKRIVWTTTKGEILNTKAVKPDVLAAWLAKPDVKTKLRDCAIILNNIPIEEAVAIFIEDGKKERKK